jgi:four helix bundle protein
MKNQDYIPLEEPTMEWFSKKTIGGQFVETAYSIAANISEGYGRFHFKDKRNFFYHARGSLNETKTWALKSRNRDLLIESDYNLIIEKLKNLHKALNGHIKSLPIN